jgi:zinc/manganese transport system permease protein
VLGQEFMRNALLAGTFIALACGVSGWFVVLRAQVFAGDALSHVAFPGALAAAAAGIDERAGLFAATVLVGAGIGLLGLGGAGAGAGRGGVVRAAGGSAGQDTAIGIVFTFVLGLGVFFLTLFSMGAAGGAGIQAAHTLFGSIYGLGGGEARVAAAVALAATAGVLAIARPLLFVSLAPDLAAARGVPARLLSVGFLALLGVVAAGATQAVGALLLLGLLTGPAAAAHRLTGRPFAGIALAGLLGVSAMWGGLALSYAVPRLPPSTAIVALAVGVYAVAAIADTWTRRGARSSRAGGGESPSTKPPGADVTGTTIAT